VERPLDARRLINLFLAGATVCAVWSIFAHLTIWSDGRARSFSGDYMAAGGMYMLAVTLTLSRIFFNRPGERRVWLLPLVLLGTALLMTYTRSSWMGALTGFVILGIAKDWRFPAAGLLLLAGFLWLFPQTQFSQRVFSVNSKTITSNVERKYMWDTGLKLLRDRPWLGYGVDNLSLVYGRYVHPEAIEQSPPHVHNTLLQLALNGGLLAVFFFIWLAVALLNCGRKSWLALHRAAPERAGEVLGLTAALAGFLINGLFEFNFGTAQVITLFYFLMGILVRTSAWGPEVADFSLPKTPRFLFLRPRFRGDVLLASAVPRLVKRDFPQARVDLLTEPAAVPIARGERAWDQVLALPRRGFKAWWQMILTVRRADYDVVADLFGNPRTAQLAWFSGARLKIGPHVRIWEVFFHLRTQADRPGPRPAWEAYLDVLRALGMKQLSLRPRWEVAPEDERFVAAWLRERRLRARGFIGVFPGGTHPAKRWPLARFLETAQQCRRRLSLPSVFVFGPLEKDLKAEYEPEGAKLRLSAEDFTPGQLGALWAAAAAVLSNDAFPMHLGPAVGTPTVGLFGPGEPAVWFPYSEKNGHRFLHAAPECWPCHQDICEDNICWRELAVGQVVEAVAAALGRGKRVSEK
jgi:ADP-heptose:LPS heptosyltransferase